MSILYPKISKANGNNDYILCCLFSKAYSILVQLDLHLKNLGNYKVSKLQYECLCRFYSEPLGLKCEMTIMPFEWVLGHDTSY